MIQAWQKRLLNNKPQYRRVFTENGTVTLDAGYYKFTLVGGGAGGIGGLVGRPGDPEQRLCVVQGGVGGTLIGLINIPVQTTLTLTVGLGGQKGGWQGTDTSTGYAGQNTTVSGFAQGELVAGGGVAPSISIFRGNFTPTVGIQGINQYFDGFSILQDNKNKIVSTSLIGQVRDGSNPPTLLLNTNYEPDTTKGAGGNNGWAGNVQLLELPGGNGIIVIENGD